MKLAPLLAQFLYSNKRLELPGIGIFLLNAPFENEPDGKQSSPADISFENKPSLKETPELVQYIASQTGKIKALAAADLDSHLNIVQQFLNIGKPFLLEGIGSLVKMMSGEYAFSAGEIVSDKLKSYTAKEISATSSTEESFSNYKKPMNSPGNKMSWRKPAIALLILAGIGLAVWGGYTVYKITTSKNRSAHKETPIKKDEPVLVQDTVSHQQDSPIAATPASAPGNYRFVLEVANPKRALYRYNKLKANLWNVQMETKDSISYTLFMMLPATVADTSHIIDSLRTLNGKRVYVN